MSLCKKRHSLQWNYIDSPVKKKLWVQLSVKKFMLTVFWDMKGPIIIDLLVLIPDIGIMVRVFTNGPGDLGSIPSRVIPKTQKMVLDAILLNTQHYKYVSRVKWSNPGKGVTPSPTLWCSSYRKGSLRVTLDYGRHLYFYYIYLMTATLNLCMTITTSFCCKSMISSNTCVWNFLYLPLPPIRLDIRFKVGI